MWHKASDLSPEEGLDIRPSRAMEEAAAQDNQKARPAPENLPLPSRRGRPVIGTPLCFPITL